MAMSGDIVVTRWELMREWPNHQTDSWDLEGVLELYKMVKTSEAELQGLPAPSFEVDPMIPGKTEAEKTLEPTADDPPIDCVGGKYSMKRLLQLPGSCSRFRVPAPASGSCPRVPVSCLRPWFWGPCWKNTQVLNSSISQAGHRPPGPR